MLFHIVVALFFVHLTRDCVFKELILVGKFGVERGVIDQGNGFRRIVIRGVAVNYVDRVFVVREHSELTPDSFSKPLSLCVATGNENILEQFLFLLICAILKNHRKDF